MNNLKKQSSQNSIKYFDKTSKNSVFFQWKQQRNRELTLMNFLSFLF